MDSAVTKKTQDSLGKIIKKPPLTEKLLSKPPFRFLHDVMTSVVKTTGFMQGLFTDSEMNSENVKDKDSKVAFLQKVVDMVAAVTGKSLSVRPIKIVAGHEPEKTNEFLQVLADAINKNVDNDEYVRRVLKGEKGGGKEEKKEKSSKDRTKSADRRKAESDNKADREKDEEKSRDKGDRDRDRHADRGKSRGGDRDRHGDREKNRDRSRGDGRDERHRDKSRKSFPMDPEPKASSSHNTRKSLSRLPVPTSHKNNTSSPTLSSTDNVAVAGGGSSVSATSSKSRQTKSTKSAVVGGAGLGASRGSTLMKPAKKTPHSIAIAQKGVVGSKQKSSSSSSSLSGKMATRASGKQQPPPSSFTNSPGGDSPSTSTMKSASGLNGVGAGPATECHDSEEEEEEGMGDCDDEDLDSEAATISDRKSRGDGLLVLSSRDLARERGRDQSDNKNRDQSKEKENESPARQNGEDKHDPPPRLQRPSSAKGSRRRREAQNHAALGEQNKEFSDDEEGGRGEGGGGEDEEEEEERREPVIYGRRRHASEDEEFQKEMAPSKEAVIGEGDLPPQISAARQLARPSSARPAPPRPKQEASESEPAMRLGGSQPANVIVDNGMDDEDDDENFLVEESAPPPPTEIEPQPISKPTEEDDTEHGALVKKMLESKKELEGGSQTQQAAQAKKTEIERPVMSDAQRRKQREQVQKEVDKLRASIQSLTRSANPLGKVMDYVQEDLDSMQQELDKWKQENGQLGLDLKREMNVTDRAVEPLKQQLAELERAIGDQLDQIAATKCKIIKNDTKMEKMLKSIAKS